MIEFQEELAPGRLSLKGSMNFLIYKAFLIGLFILFFYPINLFSRDWYQDLVYERNFERLREEFSKRGATSFEERARIYLILGYAYYQKEPVFAKRYLSYLANENWVLSDYASFYLAELLRGNGDKESAISFYRKVRCHKNYIYILARLNLFKLLLESDSQQELVSLFSELSGADKPNNLESSWLYLLYLYFQKMGEDQKKLEFAKKLWVNYPLSKEAKVGEGLSYNFFEKKGRVEKLFEKKAYLQVLKEIDPVLMEACDISSELEARLYSLKLESLFNLKRYEKLIELTDGDVPKLSEAESLFYRAYSYQRLGDTKKALHNYYKVWRYYPDSAYSPKALFNAGRMELANGDKIKSFIHFDKLVNDYPDSELCVDACFHLGYISYQNGEYSKAKNWFQKSIGVSGSGGCGVSSGSSVEELQRNLYWLYRTLERLGEVPFREKWRIELEEKYPYSGYVFLMNYKQGFVPKKPSRPEIGFKVMVDLPYELEIPVELARIGLIEEARNELNYYFSRNQAELVPAMKFQLVQSLYDVGAYQLGSWFYWKYVEGGKKESQSISEPLLGFPRAYPEYVYNLSFRFGIPEALVQSIIFAESRFEPRALSKAGAMGLMQLLPSVADQTARKHNLRTVNKSELYNPSVNLELGCAHFKDLLLRYEEKTGQDKLWSIILALCAYNAGVGRADRWYERVKERNLDYDGFIEEIPFQETRLYVKRVLGYYYAYTSILGI